MGYDISVEYWVNLTKECDSPKFDATLYQYLVDRLIYLNSNQPDISLTIKVVSQFMQDLWESHLKDTKRIIHYIKGTYQRDKKYCSDKVN